MAPAHPVTPAHPSPPGPFRPSSHPAPSHPPTPAHPPTPGARLTPGSGGSSRFGSQRGRLLAGVRLGRYEIIDELGRGGMGVVYRARDVEIGRLAAVKILSASADPTAVARLEREAKAIARLEHPGIVRIYDSGRADDGRPFLAMELVDGVDLQRALAKGTIALADRVRLVAEAARALQHAHDHGVLHRDVKPANVLVDRDGRARVLDFGIGKIVGADSLTKSGAILGTFAYMAPEQVRGERAVGPAADVYALGATLFDVVTGRTPLAVTASHPANAMLAILSQDAPPASRVAPPGTFGAGPPRSAAIDAVCARALRKDPAKRYPSAGAFADELDRALLGDPTRAERSAAARSSRRSRGPVLAASAAALVVAVGLVVVVAITMGGDPETAPRTTAVASGSADAGSSAAARLARREAEPDPSSSEPGAGEGAEPAPVVSSIPASAFELPVLDPTPAPELTAERLLEISGAVAAAVANRDHAGAVACYRMLGVGGDLDRLATASNLIDPPIAIGIWGWASTERASVGDRAGFERSIGEFDRRIRLNTPPGRVPSVAELQQKRARTEFGEKLLGFIEASRAGDPHHALREAESLRHAGRASRDPALIAMLELARARALVPAIVRAEPRGQMTAAIIEEHTRTPEKWLPFAVTSVDAIRAQMHRSLAPPELDELARDPVARLADDMRLLVDQRIVRIRGDDGAAPSALGVESPERWTVEPGRGLHWTPDPAAPAPGDPLRLRIPIALRFERIEVELTAPADAPVLFELVADRRVLGYAISSFDRTRFKGAQTRTPDELRASVMAPVELGVGLRDTLGVKLSASADGTRVGFGALGLPGLISNLPAGARPGVEISIPPGARIHEVRLAIVAKKAEGTR